MSSKKIQLTNQTRIYQLYFVFYMCRKYLLHFTSDIRQPVKGCVQCIILLRKVDADQMIHIFPEEAGTGNCCYSNVFDHPLTELQVCVACKLRQIQEILNIDQYKISSLRNVMF